MGHIRLYNIRVEGRHGVYEAERAAPTTFTVNVDIVARDLDTPARTDDLADTMDYARVAEIVRDVIAGPSRNLLEALAGDILDRLGDLPGIGAATVRVRKPQPATMEVSVEGLEVELTRSFT